MWNGVSWLHESANYMRKTPAETQYTVKTRLFAELYGNLPRGHSRFVGE
jgi:hypothetical protein